MNHTLVPSSLNYWCNQQRKDAFSHRFILKKGSFFHSKKELIVKGLSQCKQAREGAKQIIIQNEDTSITCQMHINADVGEFKSVIWQNQETWIRDTLWLYAIKE